MELHELDVAQPGADARREREAVARTIRSRWSCGIERADAARREHDWRASSTHRPVAPAATTPRTRRHRDQLDGVACSTLDPRVRRFVAAASARTISAPVASPPACTMRCAAWPLRAPARGCRSRRDRMARRVSSSHSIASAAPVVSVATARGSLRCRPRRPCRSRAHPPSRPCRAGRRSRLAPAESRRSTERACGDDRNARARAASDSAEAGDARSDDDRSVRTS